MWFRSLVCHTLVATELNNIHTHTYTHNETNKQKRPFVSTHKSNTCRRSSPLNLLIPPLRRGIRPQLAFPRWRTRTERAHTNAVCDPAALTRSLAHSQTNALPSLTVSHTQAAACSHKDVTAAVEGSDGSARVRACVQARVRLRGNAGLSVSRRAACFLATAGDGFTISGGVLTASLSKAMINK